MDPGLSDLVKIRPRPETAQVSRGRTSLVTTLDGKVHPEEAIEGLYVYDTRVLSRYAWLLNGKSPTLSCSSNLQQFSWMAYFVETPKNCKQTPSHQCNPLEQTLELRIAREVGEGMHEDVHLTNHTQVTTTVDLQLHFDIDCVARQEVEDGRKQRGRMEFHRKRPEAGVWELVSMYHARHKYKHQDESGVSRLDRGLVLRIANADTAPRLSRQRVSFRIHLAPHQHWHACLSWIAYVDGKQLPLTTRCSQVSASDWNERRARYMATASSFSFAHGDDLTATAARVLRRSKDDLEALRLHDLEAGEPSHEPQVEIALAAGIPTYQEIFGRDMEAAAWQAAMLSPEFLRGTLHVLNPLGATDRNDWRDAEPGRLPHEIHTDPLSVLNFEPKSRYFGSVSSSFLFPIMVAELWHWTGDKDAIRPYLDTAMKALQWADTYSLDSTGFYRYKTHSEQGEKNQGWKDSDDAIVYPDGAQVKAPIGTSEMQAFMYAAKLHFSEVMFCMGQMETARRLYREATELKARFNEKFWMEEEGYFAMGIGPKGELIRSIGSDAGHCLLAGIADESRTKRVAARLMRPDLFSGWGIRTLSADHPSYNPFAYHRGTVWPVTTAAFVLAFSRYGLHGEMNQLSKAFFEAARLFENDRLPEVFAGHQRSQETPFPGLYTKANWPQAWSASAPFTVLQAILGLYPYAPAHVLFVDPHLPEWLPEITVEELHLGDAVATLRFTRDGGGRTDFKIVDLRGTLHVVRQPSPWSQTSGWAERIRDLIASVMPHRQAS